MKPLWWGLSGGIGYRWKFVQIAFSILQYAVHTSEWHYYKKEITQALLFYLTWNFW